MFNFKKLSASFIFITALIITPIFFGTNKVKAENSTTSPVLIEIFYSTTCPHCQNELSFLRELELKKGQKNKIKVEKYVITKKENQEILKQKLEEKDALNYFGAVPITFVNGKLFVGFSENTTGENILKITEGKNEKNNENTLNVPFLGKINTQNYSLPALAVILGSLDGFNVCSLGALILILGLVLTLKDRKKILLYGGAFIAVTAVIYGLLIALWHQLFSLLSNYIVIMQAIIATLGIGGGLYFFKEFTQYRKYGPNCNTSGMRLISRLSKKVEEGFKNPGATLSLFGAIALFAAVLTIVEFPCSATVPVAFAGVLATENTPIILSIFYIALFVLFYMLDELVIFALTAYKMNIKATSGKFTTWAVLIEGILLTLLGVYYLWGVISHFL